MQTLRKKTSPLKYKNETSRFLGEGVSFKAKLIGILEVSEARGDRMCQEALSDLKMAIRAAGEHKQRITMNIAIDGLRLRDEKTGDSLYHHPVHKISFIAQDMTDSRAFGYIFGSPDTGHRFFGIKTDKAASQVVIAMRDLFQVVFALKRKEIEVAKQNLDKNRFVASSIFPDNSISNVLNKSLTSYQENATTKSSVLSETKPDSQAVSSERKASSPMLVSLLDLELELNSLQQGISQMERITPSESSVGKGDPFGDSFTEFSAYPKPILPPPPSGRERSSRLSESSGKFSPKTPHTASTVESTLDQSAARDGPESNGWFTPSVGDKLFEEPPLVPDQPTKDRQHEQLKHEIMAQFDVFTELDPLGTGKTKPYVDKKHFFQELKNPPKKVLNDLMEKRSTQSGLLEAKASSVFNSDPFGEDPFDKTDPFSDSDPFDTTSFTDDKNLTPLFSSGLSVSPNRPNFVLDKQLSLAGTGDRSPNAKLLKQNTFDCKFNNNLSSVGENEDVPVPEPPPRPVAGDFVQIKPPPLPPKKLVTDASYKPPPRPPYTDEPNYDYIGSYEATSKRSCDGDKTDESPPLPAPSRKTKPEPDASTPAPERPRRQQPVSQSSEEDYLTPISFPKLQINIARHRGPVLLPPPQKTAKKQNSIHDDTKTADPESLEGLDITLSQLTLSGLNELATKLNIPTNQLSNMTLVQLTAYISNFIKSQSVERGKPGGDFKEDFADFNNFNSTAGESATEADQPDKYAVFRELLGEEIKQTHISDMEDKEEEEKLTSLDGEVTIVENGNAADRYAALREIVETEIIHTVIAENDNVVVNADKENNVDETDKEDQENETMESGTAGVVDDRKELISPPVDTESNQISTQANRLTSGSLSDIVSGSSPEIDTSEVKKSADTAGESWAVFADAPKQSEEGVSPWSSDSKEFGNGSPPEWTTVRQGWDRPKQEQEEWWDAAEDIVDDSVQVSRRSLDSYEDEGYDRYGHPLMARRKQPSSWGSNHERQPTIGGGGHSSSSRDVSPWEEEPRHREHWEARERKEWQAPQPPRHSRQSSFERQQRPRRHADSWDEEDDYEYDEERSGRYHWPECYCPRDIEKERGGSRDRGWIDERRHYRRKDMDWDKYCCPDWESEEMDHRYRWSYRKCGTDRHYGRWEGEQEDPQQHYLTTKPRNWKQRPSSASEMDRKSGENKNWPGGSDGERDRRYRANRRSRSRDSHLAEPVVYSGRHKADPNLTLRGSHRAKTHQHQVEEKQAAMFSLRKKPKEPTGKSEEPRIKVPPAHMFENNFTPSDTDSPASAPTATKFAFENDFETSEADSPIATKPPTKKAVTTAKKTVRHKTFDLDRHEPKKDASTQRTCQKSPFEDDFSPPPIAKKEEEAKAQPEEPISVMRRKLMGKGRFPGSLQDSHNLKKSESVNIFVRESDPFDDEFFSGERRKGAEYKWSEDFEDYDLDQNN